MSPLTNSQTAAVPARLPAPPAPLPVARPGAQQLLARLHGLHAEELARFCRWMLHDADDAADALQDTWIRALAALQDGRMRVVAHRPWLFAVARNVCLDRLRGRKRAALHDIDEAALGDAPGADEVLEMRHEAAAALALVGSLSERQRSALLMRDLAQMSIPDIASALDLSAERAAWAVTDARRALAEARAGSGLACEDIRDRLGAGHRSRALKVHLDGCDACRAHDRRLRTRRLLAPALFPLAWLRRWSWPAFAKPLAASVVVGMTAVALPVAHPGARPPAVRAAAPPRGMHHREPAAAPRPRPVVRAERKRSLRPVELPVTAGQVPAAARPPARLTPAPGAVTAAAAVVPTPPARAAAGVVRAASAPVLGVLDRVAGAGAASPAGPVVTRAAATVDAVVGALG